MLPPLSPNLKEKDAIKWMASLSEKLQPGEEVQALARSSTFKPLTDGMAITNQRVMLFLGASVASKGPLVQVATYEIVRSEVKLLGLGRNLTLIDSRQESRSFATVKPDDAAFVVEHVNRVARVAPAEQPTVDVYDPFTAPWDKPAPASSSDVVPPVPTLAPQAPPSSSLRPEPVADPVPFEPMEPVVESNAPAAESKQRLLPRWKTIPAWVVSAFFFFILLTAIFSDTAPEFSRLGNGLLALSFMLIPLLALSRARRNALRRRSKTHGNDPRYGWFEKNYLPVGIPLILVIFVASIVAS